MASRLVHAAHQPHPPSTLLDLPEDVLRHTLSFLGTRSLLHAACTCKTLRALVDGEPLHPVMTSGMAMAPWLMLPKVALRVRTLIARRSLWGRCSFLGALVDLRCLVVTFGHVSSPICRHLPPTLEYLDLHRLDCEYGDVFQVSRFRRLPRLHTLKLTFTRNWDLVVLDGVDHLPLRHLAVKNAPALVVRMPLRVPTLRLHAHHALICPFEIHSEDLALTCVEGAVGFDVMLTEASCRDLRALSLQSPRRVTVPCLSSMTRLESLALRFDSALLPLRELARLEHLRSVTVDTRYGVAVAGMHAKLPRRVAVRASVAGVPMSAVSVRAMFHGGAKM